MNIPREIQNTMSTNTSNPHNSRRDFIRQSTMAATGAMLLPRLAQGATPSISSSLSHDRWPGRLVVGGKTLDDFIAISEEASPNASWTLRVYQSVSVPELQIRSQERTVGAVTEWIPTLVNNAEKPSGKVTKLHSLAASWPTRGPVNFYGNKGASNKRDEFLDRIEHDIDLIELIPAGGRSSDGILPFFALTDRHDSLAIGIGWSGRWSATLRHASGNLEVEVGLPNVGFVLRPGESVRLPSVLLARAPGAGADQARRLVRTHLINHVIPKTADGQSPNFTTYSTVYQSLSTNPLFGTQEVSEQVEIAHLERAAAMGFETYWIDATWYGNSRLWTSEVGNWYARRSDFPRGLRPISDRAHELGMKFLFWMEPERAKPDSEWVRKHPDLFLTFSEENNPYKSPEWRDGMLLNLADPRAVDLAFSKISALITEFNADVYRQDFNIKPLALWYAADAQDRVGITEIRYIEGLYALWDRLLAAHPGLVIDNCASGGRRIDLETLRRSMPLWRSDYLMDKTPAEMAAGINIANQTQGWGLGHWTADHLGWIRSFDAYAIRSVLATGFMSYRALPDNEQNPEYADAIAAVAENKRLRPLICEERIGLIAPDLEKEAWTAFQHHRHSDSSGIIVALRGPGVDSDSITLRPEHIDVRGTYQVTRWDDYRAAPATRIAGAELKEILVTIPKTRSSVLVEYRRVS